MINKFAKQNTCLSCILLFFFLCGCSFNAPDEEEKTPTGEMVPTAEYYELPFDFGKADLLLAGQSALYYLEKDWNEEEKFLVNRLYFWETGQASTELLLEKGDLEQEILSFFADNKGNGYCFGYNKEEEEIKFFLEKYGQDGGTVWNQPLLHNEMKLLEGIYIAGGAADEAGRICLYDSSGKLYLFDGQGQFYKCVDTGWETLPALLATGESKLIVYRFDYDRTARMQKLIYAELDMGQGLLSEEKSFSPSNGFAVQELWNGKGGSFLFADENTLWQIEADTGKAQELLFLDEEYVNVDGTQLQEVNIGEDGAIRLYLYDTFSRRSEYVLVTWQDKGLLPEKETVTIGVTPDSSTKLLNQYAKRFNRESLQYRVELVEYFSFLGKYDNYLDELTTDIIKGNAPDMIDARAIPMELLADKDFFENLEPYFKRSKLIHKKNLLESVWRAGQYNGKMTFVMPWFLLEAAAVKNETLDGKPWNLDTLVSLIDENPDIDVLSYLTDNKRRALLEFALEANCESFYDVKKRSCSFTDGRFASLLEAIGGVEQRSSEIKIRKSDEYIEDFIHNRVLVYQNYIRNMEGYLQTAEAFGDTVSWVGYPSEEEQYHRFQSFLLLGINRESNVKEGAWAFLEYLLSEEIQKWEPQAMGFFPVRKDAFEQYISVAGIDNAGSLISAAQEEKDALQELAEHAYLHPYRLYDPLHDIVLEECDAYFAGDKSIEQVTGNIQNRVTLYLQESK